MFYADTSALAKLILDEPESEALRTHIAVNGAPASSVIVTTELMRAVRRTHPDLEAEASRLLATIVLVDVERTLLLAAGRVEPAALRSLDAIHLATALSLGLDLDALVTYDARMAEAARRVRLVVEAPA